MIKKCMMFIVVFGLILTSCQSIKQDSGSVENINDTSKNIQLNNANVEHLEKAINLLNEDQSFEILSKNVLKNSGEKDVVETSIDVDNKYDSSANIHYKKTKVHKGKEEQYTEIYTDTKSVYVKYNDNNWMTKSLGELKTKFEMNGKKAVINYLENIKKKVNLFTVEEKDNILVYSYINSDDANRENVFLSFVFDGQIPDKTDDITIEDFKCNCEIYKDTGKVKSLEVLLKYKIEIDGHETSVESVSIMEISSLGEELKIVLPTVDIND